MTESAEKSRPLEETPGTIEYARRIASKGYVHETKCALALIPGLKLADGVPIELTAIRIRAAMHSEEAEISTALAGIATDPVMKEGLLERASQAKGFSTEMLISVASREQAMGTLKGMGRT